VLGAAGVEVIAHDAPGIVDADGLGPDGAGKVDGVEAAVVGKAVQRSGQVPVHPDDQTGAVDAGGNARARARDGQDLLDPAPEGERGHGRGAAAGIETKAPTAVVLLLSTTSESAAPG